MRRDGKLHAKPVAAVKIDHSRTTRVRRLRAPKRSQSHPLGISQAAYVTPNAEKTSPI
jgi:hypothetical protein